MNILKSNAIDAILAEKENHYRLIRTKKKTLSVSHGSLKHIQDFIETRILKKVKVHKCAHGYIQKRGIVTNARRHVGKLEVLTVDIKDFFESIKINLLVKAFKKSGHTPLSDNAELIANLITFNDTLPRGVSTSPSASNIFCIEMDKKILTLSNKHHLAYTRYSDDMTFSGNFASSKEFAIRLEEILELFEFKLNKKKTKLQKNTEKQIVTGVIVNKKLNIDRVYIENLKKQLYKEGINSSTRGKLSFVKQINPDRYQKLIDKYKQLEI